MTPSPPARRIGLFRIALILVASGLSTSLPAAGQAVPPAETSQTDGSRREVRGQFGASVNNAGLQNTIEMSWSNPLSASQNPLLAGAHLSAGVVHVMTPALTRIGAWAEYAPLSILTVRAGVEPGAYFGTFRSLMSFDAYTGPFDKASRDRRSGYKAGVGVRAYVTPAVQLRIGPVVGRLAGDFERWHSTAAGPLFYEPTRDTLLKASGDHLVNTTGVAMYQHDYAGGGHLAGGVIHNLTHVFRASGNRSERLGAIAVREFARPRLRLPHPRITMVVWRYLHDPSKRHQWGAALAVGFRTGR